MPTIDGGAESGEPPDGAWGKRDGARQRARLGLGWIALATVVLAFLTHADQLALGLVGHDTLPVIVTARVRSIGDVLELFAMKLMDDRFDQDYYRPVLNLSVAFDEHLFGLAPRGYQVHSIALFAAAAVALAWLTRRMLHPRAWIGPVVCAAIFTLHPSHVDVLPIVPRRHETLACFFAALALATQLSPSALGKPGRLVLPGLCALLAMGSKETALALPALLFAAAFLYSQQTTPLARTLFAARATWSSWVALGLALLARLVVLGGLGGPRQHGIALHPGVAADILEGVFLPHARSRTLGALLVLALGIALAGAWLAIRNRARAQEEPPPPFGVAASVAALWMVGTALVHSLGGAHQPWYELLPLAGFALFAGVAVDALVWRLRRERAGESTRGRAWCAAALMGLSALFAWQVSTSPLVLRYPEWTQADHLRARYFARLRPLLDAAPLGSSVSAQSVPTRVVGDGLGPEVTDAAILTQRSVQAWTELVWPERRFRVVKSKETTRARPDEVVVVLQGQKDVEAATGRD